MPCKSLRFVVSPLTVPVEHDRRRCTGRNTIISAVNKFLHDISISLSLPLSTKSSCPTDFHLSLPGRVPNPRRDILESSRAGRHHYRSDPRSSPIDEKKWECVYVLLIDHDFSVAHPIDWRLLYLSCLFYPPRFDQRFINFLLDRILNKDRPDYFAREKMRAWIKTVRYM